MTTMTDLSTQRCVPCEGGTEPMSISDARMRMELVPGWILKEDATPKLTRTMKFRDFAQAMIFVNRVADIAEEEGHHPDFRVSWNRVEFELVMHAIGGLSDNDFIIAAKINIVEMSGDKRRTLSN